MSIILKSVLPVAFIIIIGYVAGKKLTMERSTLSQLSVYILAPALVTDSFYRNSMGGTLTFRFLFAYGVISLILYIGLIIFSKIRKLSKESSRNLFAILLCPNNGNMGLSISAFALGDEGLQRAVVYMIGSSIVLFGILPAVLKGESIVRGVKMTLRLPLIWAMVLGIILQLSRVSLPFNLGISLEWLGISSIPIALLILGMQLTNTRFHFNLSQFLASLTTLAIAPLVALGVGKMMSLEGIDLQVLVLQTAMPTAVNTAVMMEEFGSDATMVSRTVILSTLMSFITIPMVILFLTSG